MSIELLLWKEADIPSILQHANNRNIWNHVRDDFPHPYTQKDAEEWIARNKAQNPPTSFSISVDGKAVGAVGVLLKSDVYRKNAEIGYWLAEPFWNQGITSEAVRLFCSYCFASFDVARLYAGVFANNPASMRVLDKNGFQQEAILHSAVYKNASLMDEYIFARLRS